MSFFVYLIVSRKNFKLKTYVGYTHSLKKRLVLHNSGKGAKSTKGRIWKIAYFKKYNSKKKAMSQEYLLKKDRKKRKIIITKFLSTNKV